MRIRTILGIAAGVAAIVVVIGAKAAVAKDGATPQCSLAFFSKPAASGQTVCDLGQVRRLARDGHVFEQNQMGIASVLAIGPGLSDKDAIGWFQRAAQSGYAPAQ